MVEDVDDVDVVVGGGGVGGGDEVDVDVGHEHLWDSRRGLCDSSLFESCLLVGQASLSRVSEVRDCLQVC